MLLEAHQPEQSEPVAAAAAQREAAPQSALFPPRAERAAVEDVLSALLQDARAGVVAGPVGAVLTYDDAVAQLRAWDFTSPRCLQDVLGWVVAGLASGAVHVDHPRYFGLFNPTPTFPAQCAERVVAAFNPQLATHVTAPFPVAVEAHLIRALADRAGFGPGAGGHFTSGGSEANFTAAICALTHAAPQFGQEGARAFDGRPLIYVSKAAHLAWLKIAHQAGIGRGAIRLMDTDGGGRMDPAALGAAIAADVRAGGRPVMIVSTAGTTGAGMIDPIAACTALARRHGAWHHVDAAWGGAALVSDRLRPLLDGIGSADSVTIDAHKWLATTMGCGIFIAAEAGIQNRAFYATMACMPSASQALDPYVNTCQWSRRFLGLRLFLALASGGWEGYAAFVERTVALAATLAAMLRARGWTIVNRSELAVLCACPPQGAAAVADICATVVAGGAAWVSVVEFEDQASVRLCITSGETTQADLDRLVEALCDAAVAHG